MDFGKRLILGWGLHQKDKNVLKTSSNTFNIDGFCNQTLLIGKHGGIHHSPITATFIKKCAFLKLKITTTLFGCDTLFF